MPVLVRDLASLFGPEASPQNLAHGTVLTSSKYTSLQPLGALRPRLVLLGHDCEAKTIFLIAHPPPVAWCKQRLSIRPHVILQLQHASDGLQPLPAFNVISPAAFASQFNRSMSRVRKGEKCISTSHLFLVRSESFGRMMLVNGAPLAGSVDETTNRPHGVRWGILSCKKSKRWRSRSRRDLARRRSGLESHLLEGRCI